MKTLLFLALGLSVFAVDFNAALSLPKRTENKVFRDRVKANWLPDGKAFWYRVQTGPQAHEFVLINSTTGERKVAPDLKSLGLPSEEGKTSLMNVELRSTKRTGESSGLKFINRIDVDVDLFWINQEGEHIRYGSIRAGTEREQHTFEGHVWLITSRTGEHLGGCGRRGSSADVDHRRQRDHQSQRGAEKARAGRQSARWIMQRHQ
jgi:dipeptidyl-peptidase-4